MISKKFFKNLVLLPLFLANTRMLLSMDNPLENSFDFVPYHNDLTAKVVNLGQNVAVSGHKNGKIIFWDVQKRKVKSLFWGHRALVKTLLFSPDCRAVVSLAVDDTLILWDVVMCRKNCDLLGHSAQITSLAFSPDGRLFLSASYDDTVRLWDARTGRCLYVFSNKDCSENSERSETSYILNGNVMVSGVWSDSIRLRDSIGGFLEVPFGGNGGVESAKFSSSGSQIIIKLKRSAFLSCGMDRLVTYSDMLYSRAVNENEHKVGSLSRALNLGLELSITDLDRQSLTSHYLKLIYEAAGVTPWKEVLGDR